MPPSVHSSRVSLAERLMVILGVLPSCHLLWRMMLSSALGDRRNLPWLHAVVADWVIRPRLLLVLAAAFVAGFLCVPFAKEDARKWLGILRFLSTLVVVLALSMTALAFAALLFPIRSMPPTIPPPLP